MNAQDANRITLKTYSDKAQAYIDSTPQKINDAEYPWIDQALHFIPHDGKILEIGSGSGRNAQHIAGKGYDLECTEAVPEFVEIMTQKGLAARLLNILTDQIDGQYDMVFANGVLVHFTPEQSRQVFTKIHGALNPNGIFAFSVKMGMGEKWSDEKLNAPRYFYFWQPDVLRQLAEETGFEWLSVESGDTSLKNAKWLYIILRRKQV